MKVEKRATRVWYHAWHGPFIQMIGEGEAHYDIRENGCLPKFLTEHSQLAKVSKWVYKPHTQRQPSFRYRRC